MQYNKFIQSSFTIIKHSRENFLGFQLFTKKDKIPAQPQNLYIELLAQKDKQMIKIEQWNFKCLKTLVQSQYQSNHDSELDSIQMQKKSFFSILEQKLLKFNPKSQIKTFQPKKIILALTTKQKQLKNFIEEDKFLVNIEDYEGQGFNCHVTLETIQTEMNKKQRQIGLQTSQDQFQVLEDSTFEQEKKLKEKQQEQKQKQIQKKIESPLNKKTQQFDPSTKSHKENQDKPEKQMQKPITSIEKLPQSSKNTQKLPTKEYLYISKYSTKQVILSDYQRKISIIGQTLDLIQQANLGGDTLRNFLKKIE